MIIDEIVVKVLEMGLDIGTKDAVKNAMDAIDADTRFVDEVYIGIKNRLNLKAFLKVEVSRRAVFLPQCLRSSTSCKAELSEFGYTCKRCGACPIPKILDAAGERGYKIYIVPGGSMVFNIVKKTQPLACIGVGCYPELEDAIAKLGRAGIPTQAVPLLRDGCKDTQVDVERIIKVLRL
jgi:hypothetical protein